MDGYTEGRYTEGKYKDRLILLLALLAAALIVGAVLWKTDAAAQGELQQELAQEVLRFHVLADSDSAEDQRLKLKVRDAVLAYLEEEMPSEPDAGSQADWVRRHTDEIEAAGREALLAEGSDDPVNAAVTTCYFPDRTFGEMLFPAGNYEALRVEIGAAEGHNWWCVLYPGICFDAAVNVVTSDGGSGKMNNVLTEEEYSGVTATSDFKISWYFWKGNE